MGIDVNHQHLTAGNSHRIGQDTLARLAWHLVRGEHDGDNIVREGVAVALSVAGLEVGQGIPKPRHVEHGRARVDAGRSR